MLENDTWQRKTEANHPATSVPRLEELSADPSLRPIVAGNPAAPASLLETLAQDQDAQVREKVAGNPNTPWKTLEVLAPEFPDAFLSNPVGALQLVVHPESISTEGTFWDALLRVAAIPTLWWRWLRNNPKVKESSALRLHVQYAGETTHPYGAPTVGEERDLFALVQLLTVALAQDASLHALPGHRLADQAVFTTVQEHLQWLAQSPDERIRLEVASHPQAPANVLRTLVTDKELLVRTVATRNPRMPVDVLLALAQDQNASMRGSVAGNPQTPAEVLHILAQDQNARVREAVASHPQTPVEALRILAQDQDTWVREAVAKNKQTPVEALRILAQDQDTWVLMAVTANKQTPVEVLQEVLRVLAKAPEPVVRRDVAEYSKMPVEMLRILAQDHEAKVREIVAENEQTPIEILRTLAQDQETEVRSGIARNEQAPLEVLQMLAKDQEVEVRGSVAWNAQIPLETLKALAQDQEAEVRGSVAENEQTPVDVLRILARDPDVGVRVAVIGHRQTPEEVLQMLAQDEDSLVRGLANGVLRQFVEAGHPKRHEAWWEQFRWIRGEPVDEQLRTVAMLEASLPVRQRFLAVLATNWDANKIQTAQWRTLLDPENVSEMKYILAPFMPALALQKLAVSPAWKVRYLVAFCAQTPWETKQHLRQDGNRYVRAMAWAQARSK